MHFVIGLGTNLGDREGYLREAVARFRALPEVQVEALSHVYETPPWGPPQPHYLNAAMRIATQHSPLQVLAHCLAIEAALGRVRNERWGPRTIDLDVLYAEEEGVLLRVDEPGLAVPHPRLFERAFALAPMLDVMPHLAGVYGEGLEMPPRVAVAL
jgi:2-amino-4-hydroxy-6-hydroxymethyldihydropteridine diphosphokinase